MFLGPETKERGVVAGVRSFVEGLKGKEWQSITLPYSRLTVDVEGDLNSLGLMLQKQVLELVALIGKTSFELINKINIPQGHLQFLDQVPRSRIPP